MKMILAIVSLMQALLLATAGEPAKTITPSASVTLPEKNDAVSTPAGRPEVADEAPGPGITRKVARAGSVAAHTLRSTGKAVLESVNPFAPLEPASSRPWLEGAAWNTAAERAAAKPGPVEVRHEPQFGWVICAK